MQGPDPAGLWGWCCRAPLPLSSWVTVPRDAHSLSFMLESHSLFWREPGRALHLCGLRSLVEEGLMNEATRVEGQVLGQGDN